MIDTLFHGVEEQYVLASRWVKDESNFADFFDRYQDCSVSTWTGAAGSRSRGSVLREPAGVGGEDGDNSLSF